MIDKQFVIYRASAGTGKTYTLVKEFLKLLISHPESYRKILAITFTNKAAAEMKERVLNSLQGITENSESKNIQNLIDNLKTELNISEADLQMKAQQALTNILHDYSSFSISTIDSFTAKIVKTFARELGFQPNFEVELDSDFFINEAIDLIVAQVGQDTTITKILTDFVQKNIDEERNYNIERNLYDFMQETWKESGVDERKKLENFTVEEILEAGKKIRERAKDLENQIKGIAKPIYDRIVNEGFDGCLYYKNIGIAGYFKNYSTIEKLKKPGKYILESVENDKWQTPKDKETKILPPDFAETMRTAFYEIEKLVPEFALYRLIVKELYSISLLNEINRNINELYDETGKVFIAEFNKRISEIIKDEPVPFIYERIGTKYEHFFIDEFQDTSDLQWTNLAPLISNSLASGKFNMIVGDGKQAIYRWRNGNVELFERLSTLQNVENTMNVQDENFIHQAVTKSLQKNYRSKKNVIQFNDQLFDFIKQNVLADKSDLLKNVYNYEKQDFANVKDGGFVSMKFLQQPDEEDEKDKSEIYYEEVLKIIQNLQKQGFALGDIAVLCRKNKTLSAISDYLTAHDISISSAESLLLCQNPDVNLLCSLIRYTADKELIADKFYILLWMLQHRNMTTNHHIFLDVKEMDVQGFQDFLNRHNIPVDFQRAKELPLLDAVTDFILDFNLNISDLYIRFFMDSLMEIVNSERLSLFGFQDWWEKKGAKLSLSVPDISNSVKMLSIHKAKGLEFPIVILPFMDEKENNTPDKVWVDCSEKGIVLPTVLLPLTDELLMTEFAQLRINEKEKKILDMLNILYVACTRSKNALFILSEKLKETKTEKSLSEKVSVPKILFDFAKSSNPNHPDEFVQGTFSLSDKSNFDNTPNITENQPFAFKPWQQKIELSRAKNVAAKFFGNESQLYGKMVHAALEKIVTEADIDHAVYQLLQSGTIANDEMKSLTEYLQKIVNHPILKKYFDCNAKVMTETDILLPKTASSIRPDRIVIIENETTIIDYKTGKPQPKDETQIQNYAAVLCEMGYDVKNKYLVYLDSADYSIDIVEVK